MAEQWLKILSAIFGGMWVIALLLLLLGAGAFLLHRRRKRRSGEATRLPRGARSTDDLPDRRVRTGSGEDSR